MRHTFRSSAGSQCARNVAAAALAVVAVLLIAVPLLAADTSPEVFFDRHKFGLQIGGGYARVKTGEDSGVFGETSSTPDDFSVGMSFGIDYGYRTTEELSLEAFLSTWTGTLSGELGNETWTVSVIGGGLRWRPMGRGFYVRGGFGASVVVATLDDEQGHDEKSEFTDYGFGVEGAMGYDFAVTGDFTAGPRLEVIALDVGDGVTSVATNMLFCFTW
jgi:opacity protein-like surface antigen